jgi:hypothetical protein
MRDKRQAWLELNAAAKAYSLEPLKQRGQDLATAACEWARASGWREPRAESPEAVSASGGPTLPNYGRNKGAPISATATADLQWYAKTLQESVDNPEKERWRQKNQEVLDAIRAELARRD